MNNGGVDQRIRYLILGLTNTNGLERTKCSQAYNWLKIYKEQILNMQPFQTKQLPVWMKIQGSQQWANQIRRDIPFLP